MWGEGFLGGDYGGVREGLKEIKIIMGEEGVQRVIIGEIIEKTVTALGKALKNIYSKYT